MEQGSFDVIGDFIDDVCDKPERFVAVDPVLGDVAGKVTKSLYDFAKKCEPKKMSPLDELLVDGFDAEQVWEELQLQNVPMLKYLDRKMRSLLANKEDVKLLPDGFMSKQVQKKRKEQQPQQPAVSSDDEQPAVGLDEEDEDEEDEEEDEEAEGEDGIQEEDADDDDDEDGGEEEGEEDSEEDMDGLDEGASSEEVDDEAAGKRGVRFAADVKGGADGGGKKGGKKKTGRTASRGADEADDALEGDEEYDAFFASVKDAGQARARAARAAKGSDMFFSLDDMEAFIDDAEQEEMRMNEGGEGEEEGGEEGDNDGEEGQDEAPAGRGGKKKKQQQQEELRDDYEESDDDDAAGEEDGAEDGEDGGEARKAMYADFFDPYDESAGPGGRDDLPLEMQMDLYEKSQEAEDGTPQDLSKLDWNKLTTYQKRMARLQQKTEKLEKAHIADKPWMLRGEVSSKERPVNSLLEASLDFERATKVAPVITEDVTNDLEAIIKRRVKEQSFDDVTRKREPVARKKRPVELDQEKSKESLTAIYEKEYMKQVKGVREPSELEKQQAEIESMFKQLCHKLDSLSHFHYAPKPVIQAPEVHANVPSIVMEEAMPIAVSTGTLLAPEEVYGKSKKEKKGETELSQEERKAARREKKVARHKHKVQQDAERKAKEKAGLIKPSEKQAKKRALAEITGKRNTKIAKSAGGEAGPTTSTAMFKQLAAEARGEIDGKKKVNDRSAKKPKTVNTSNFKL